MKSDDDTVRVIAYASRSLRLGEKLMKDYSSAKIELLALKWSVCEKFKDYLLCSKFTVYTDNNPLVYVKTSKLGVAQINWLSELALYDFDIVYRTGKSNLVADALSWRPESDNQVDQKGSQDSDEEWEAISYLITTKGCIPDDHVCISNQILSHEITSIVGGTKLDVKLKECLEIMGTAHENLGETEPIEVRSSLVNIFSHVTPKEMAEFQWADNQISAVYPWVQEGKTPQKSVLYKTRSKTLRKLFHQFERLTLKKEVLHRLYVSEDMEYHQLVLPQTPQKSVLYKTRSKTLRKLFHQFERLTLKKEVLHRLYVSEDMEYHQLVLPQRFHSKILRSVHNDMGHQGLEKTMELLQERVYWPTMAADKSNWVFQCSHCQVAKGNYTTPRPKIGHLESNNPMDLLCLDFTKIDPSRTG